MGHEKQLARVVGHQTGSAVPFAQVAHGKPKHSATSYVRRASWFLIFSFSLDSPNRLLQVCGEKSAYDGVKWLDFEQFLGKGDRVFDEANVLYLCARAIWTASFSCCCSAIALPAAEQAAFF